MENSHLLDNTLTANKGLDMSRNISESSIAHSTHCVDIKQEIDIKEEPNEESVVDLLKSGVYEEISVIKIKEESEDREIIDKPNSSQNSTSVKIPIINNKEEVDEDQAIKELNMSLTYDSIENNENLKACNVYPCSSNILEQLLIKDEIEQEDIKAEVQDDNSEAEKEISTEPVVSQRFKVNMSTIESVSKKDQATELQSLQGLSVYDQATLEAGILQQVDEALDKALESTAHHDTSAVLSLEDGELEEETEMERQIRMGEMTPFGTTLAATKSTLKENSGFIEIEKYLMKQAELEQNRKRKISNTKQNEKQKNKYSSQENDIEKEAVDNKKRSVKKVTSRQEKNKKKKKKRKEVAGTEIENSVPWTERPGLVAGEQSYMYPEEASGSEYVPSEDSEYEPSSEDEDTHKLKSKELKVPVARKKRKLSLRKPYKIPEDWASDDSDWEYSDEEGNIKKNKRSKKELDDGDVDTFNLRIRQWERERQKLRVDEETQGYHSLDIDYKLPKDLWDKLYNYQRVGVRWLWELDQQYCGGILGDEMGLGKTIQVIAFLAGLHTSDMKDKDTNFRGLGPTLIVCPTTVMHQWVKEFHKWYPPLRVAILHESGTFCGKERSRLISNMSNCGGVLIVSYTGATQYKEEMITRRWHYVILDEGHKIRNPDAQITLMVKQLRTSHRIILSGSPMQNNLKELWSLFDFVFPGKLGTLPVFLEQFAVPITQGGYANASQVQVMTAFKCATVLKDTIAPYLLRRLKADVKSHISLPEKNEQVLFCRLTDEQRHLYRGYVESGEVCRIMEGRLKIFMGLITLRKICNHPDLFSGGSKLFPGQKEEDLPEEERYGYWGKSGKMIVVEALLKIWKKQGHRVLLFTQSRQMLSIMEAFVRHSGYTYLKLDGGTSIAARQPLINKFNQDSTYFVMLLTTRVGGLGVNLTGANRVLIYDPDWNPATDTQARERAWRIGQTQNVTVYRLITAGTIEEKMYHRQIFKQFLCNKVLKDPRQRRFFKSNDLYELFTLKETDKEGSTETAAIFAGTGSEVKLDPSKTYKHHKSEPRLEAKPPAETYLRKKAEKRRKMEEKQKENIKEKPTSAGNEVCFSNEKIEHMKKLAQMLSQKISKSVSPQKIFTDFSPEKTVPPIETSSPNENKTIDYVKEVPTVRAEVPSSTDSCSAKFDLSKPSTSKVEDLPKSEDKSNGYKRKRKDKKKRKPKDAKFEGETVPHLVKSGSAALETKGGLEGEETNYATQDEYVLKKLFAKSGLQTAMKHDTIMEGGPADYALVEGEADRVAKQAVEKLKESQRECWRPTSGIPSFTGINGARNFQPKKPLFGNNKKSSTGELSASELINIIRNRNGIVDAKDSDLSLVEDIRQFVSSCGGTVCTSQIISRFEGRVAEGSSPLFKSLLTKICTFYRGPDKQGYWTLKSDFNW